MTTINLNTGDRLIGNPPISHGDLDAAEQLIRAQRGMLAAERDPQNAMEVTLARVHGAGHFIFQRGALIVAECLVSPGGANLDAWKFFIEHFTRLLGSRQAIATVSGAFGPPNGPWTAIIVRVGMEPAEMELFAPASMALSQVYVRSGHNGCPGNSRN